MRHGVLIVGLLLLTVAHASDELPVATFYAPPLVLSMGIAPDGSRLAALTRIEGRTEVSTYTLSDEGVQPESRFNVPSQVGQLTWLTSSHLGIWSSQTTINQVPNGMINLGSPFTTRQSLYALKVPTGRPVPILTQVDAVRPIVSRVADSEHHLLVHNWQRKSSHTDLHKVDLRDASSELLATGKKATLTYLLDPANGDILRLDVTRRQIELLRLTGGVDDWESIHKMRGDSRGADFISAMRSLSGKTTFLLREREEGAEYHQLFEYDLLDPDYREATIRMDGIDILETIDLPFTGEVVGFSYLTHRRQHEFFAEPLQFAQAEVDQRFPNGENIFVDGSETRRYYVFKTTEPSDPGQFILFDNERNKVTRLGSLNPELAGNATRVDRIEFKSGKRTLTGFLTVSQGAPDTNLPLVVYPNPDPYNAQWVRYEADVQLFASRGYAVFQANTRGTPGLGHGLFAAGHGQAGTVDVEDLNAGVQALARSERIDGKRICAIGRGYGGRTALQLGARTESIACVAVSQPVLSLRDWLTPSETYLSTSYFDDALEIFGDNSHLAATRPAALAEQLRAPVLYLHNGLAGDPHRAFMTAMERANAPLTAREMTLTRPATAEAMLTFVENQIGAGRLITSTEATEPQ